MNKLSYSVLPLIEELIELNKESHYCYLKAAEIVKEPVLKYMLLNFAHHRKRFADEIERQAKIELGKVAFTESLLEALHWGWRRIEGCATMQESETTAMIACQRMDGKIMQACEEANNVLLPVSLLLAINRQYASVQSTYDKLKSFSESLW
jgi:uncharacterized protein (TIGR02284 family)